MKMKIAVVILIALNILLISFLLLVPVKRVYIQPDGTIITQNRITGQLDYTDTRTMLREKYMEYDEFKVERVVPYTRGGLADEDIEFIEYNKTDKYDLSGRLSGMKRVGFFEEEGGAVPKILDNLSEAALTNESSRRFIVDAGEGRLSVSQRDMPAYLDRLPPEARKHLLKQLPEMSDYAKKQRNRFVRKGLLYTCISVSVLALLSAIGIKAYSWRRKTA